MTTLNRGKNIITRADIINAPISELTHSYTPVSNQLIINTALEEFDKCGYKLIGESYMTEKNMQKFVGKFTLQHDNPEMNMMFAFKNSYNKSMSAGVVNGAQVFVCTNGCLSGTYKTVRKHTGDANTIVVHGIKENIKKLHDEFEQVVIDNNRMKEIEMTKKTIAELVGNFYCNETIITSRQLDVIKGQLFEEEGFNYGVNNSLYNVYQAITHSLKKSHPNDYVQNHIDTHNFMLQEIN
jgi:Domain of unknown function (DUF932)